ncbi:alpha/beta hydrolase [Parahaliea maris]|uniref:Alpha/beta hydrolase n=1 Tax=Parahaliea maris TaxID=2716870 RepID=A0A5C8ZS35_9GAMM|nr:alpha/beta hydrolase [Parahaliea maris]TXS91256.1 alpha/beta hydrolase [Parahaliea maris]
MDHASRALLAEINKPDRYPAEFDIESVRASGRDTWLRFAGPVNADCSVEELAINESVSARLYRPLWTGKPATIVYFHGGGWTMGDLDSYDGLMRYLAGVGGYTVLGVEYRLAPEHPFPAAFNDCRAAVKWVLDDGVLAGEASPDLFLMGDSAGATLAAGLAIEMIREKEVELLGICLVYPVADLYSPHETYPSRLEFGDGNYLIGRDGIDLARALYLQPGQDPRDPRVSPIFSEELHCLPPTIVITAGYDPLKDEGRVLAERIASTGVVVRQRCFESTMHAFLSFGELPVAIEARDYVIRELDDLAAGRCDSS